jgi:hypothetical protein
MFAREEPQNEELNSLESALRTLKPAAASLDRDQIMYLAGQTSVQPAHGSFIRRTAWPLATAASVMLAALLGRVTAPEQVHLAAISCDLTSVYATRSWLWAPTCFRLWEAAIRREPQRPILTAKCGKI